MSKLTDEEIRLLLSKDRIIPGKTISVRNYNRLVHSIKTIINLQIKKTNEGI